MVSQLKARGRRQARERGVVTVEFALLLPLIVLILVGLVEAGHLWHLQHTITNASREGARAAIVFRKDYSPNDVKVRAQNAVNNYLSNFLPAGKWQVSFPTEPPATYQAGANITVRVTATHGLLILDALIPAFQNISIEAETTMRLE
ncbi:MAG: pilus assembly protein [Deltaproteobacteria bacterium]|nr:pilus assembly protein [Deltaproteobacteria bacterium]